MNKELPLNERIQKLFESDWVNEFNYLENQLQEARYLLTCLNEKYTQLTNNWNELEEWLKDFKSLYEDNDFQNNVKVCITVDEVLYIMNVIKDGNNV